MQTLLLAFQDPIQQSLVLVSASCKGNDGNPCPLFHGSLAPKLFNQLNDETRRNAPVRQFQALLLRSNNITWVSKINFRNGSDVADNIITTLSSTRYSSRSIKSVQCYSDHLANENFVNFIKDHCVVLEHISIAGGSDPIALPLDFLTTKNNTLRSASVEGFMTEDRAEALSNFTSNPFPNLRSLELWTCESIGIKTANFISKVAYPHGLEELNFSYSTGIDTECWALMLLGSHHTKSLKKLVATWTGPFEEEIIKTFSFCTSLQHLKLSNPHDRKELPNDDSLAHLASLTQLRDLTLFGCDGISKRGLQSLAPLKLLESLDVSHCSNLDDEAFETIGITFPNLQILRCVHNGNICKGFSSLSKLKNLSEITLNGCGKISDEALAYFGQMPALKRFHLSGDGLQVTDLGLSQLAKSNTLQYLELTGAEKITDAGIESLVHSLMDNLVGLTIECCGPNITDEASRQISRCRRLEFLSVSGCKGLTAGSLKHFENLVNLSYLDIGFVKNYGKEAIATLTQKLPTTSIILQNDDDEYDQGDVE